MVGTHPAPAGGSFGSSLASDLVSPMFRMLYRWFIFSRFSADTGTIFPAMSKAGILTKIAPVVATQAVQPSASVFLHSGQTETISFESLGIIAKSYNPAHTRQTNRG